MIQFWSPVETTAGWKVLSCSGVPSAYSTLNHRLCKYRAQSVKYHYLIEDWEDEVDDAMTISGAPPSTAFLNQFPEVVLDLNAHRGTPLVDLALECELNCFMMLPVFDQTSCVGVIEVSMRFPGGLVVIFNELAHELVKLGLSINPSQPYPKPIKMRLPGKGSIALSELKEALPMACQSHSITLGQVWIKNENYDRSHNIRPLLYKLVAYRVADPNVDDELSFVKRFYENLNVLPLRKGEGLVERTLQTHQPHISRNIYKLNDNKGLYALLSANSIAKSCTCFLICLRSSYAGQLDYVLEFFYHESKNHLAMMENLLLTLKEHLPSFSYVSGAKLGDELDIVDTYSSTPLKIFPGNQVSEIPKEVTPLMGKKRMFTQGPGELNQPKYPPLINPVDDDDDLVIIAVYKLDCKLFFLPSSSTFEKLLEKIWQELELLNPVGNYKMEYQVVPGEWFSLTDDTCFKGCISSYQTSKNINHIKLVLDAEK